MFYFTFASIPLITVLYIADGKSYVNIVNNNNNNKKTLCGVIWGVGGGFPCDSILMQDGAK